jgi:hypothetical protein
VYDVQTKDKRGKRESNKIQVYEYVYVIRKKGLSTIKRKVIVWKSQTKK